MAMQRAAGDPARRHGRVLRVASSCAAGPSCAAGRWSSAAPAAAAWSPRRRTRPAATASTRPCRRRTARRLCPHGRVPARRPRRLRRGQRGRCTRSSTAFTPLVEPLVARRGLPRRHRRLRLLGDGADDRRGRSAGARRDELQLTLLGRRGAQQVPGQAGLGGGQADRPSPPGCGRVAGVVEVRAGRASWRSSTRCRSQALWGVGPATLERLAAPRRAHRRRPRRARRADARRRPRQGARPPPPQPGHRRSTTGRSSPTGRSKSIGHEETFPPTCTTATSCAPSSCAWPTPSPPGCAPTAWRRARSRSRCASPTSARSPARPRCRRRRHRPTPSSRPSSRCCEAVDPAPGVRLLGVSASNFASGHAEQLSLLEGWDSGARRRSTTSATASVPR